MSKEPIKVIYLDMDNEVFYAPSDLYEGRYMVYKFSHMVTVQTHMKKVLVKEKIKK